jgi:Tryptophan RNA-binding attenuator protein inhibitory protein
MTDPRMVVSMRGGRAGANSLHTSVLEQKCDGCVGYGWLDAGGGMSGPECPLCGGTGTILTDPGKELLNFVRRNWWR